MQETIQIGKWGVEVRRDNPLYPSDVRIKYTRDGKLIYYVNVVNMGGGVIYKIIDYTKYAGVQLTQSVVNPWEKSTADIIITIDRGNWLSKVCDAYAHFPGLTLHTEAAIGNVVVKLGNSIYCVRATQRRRIELLNYMLRAISRSMRYDAFLLKHEVTWYVDKLDKYFNVLSTMEKINVRDIGHLMAIEKAIFG